MICYQCGLEWTPAHHSEDDETGEEYPCPFASQKASIPQKLPDRGWSEEDVDYFYSHERKFTVSDGSTCLKCGGVLVNGGCNKCFPVLTLHDGELNIKVIEKI